MKTNFAWSVKMLFRYLVLHKHISAVLKASTNADTSVNNAYTVKLAWKLETAKKTLHFYRDYVPLTRHIAHLATFQSILAFF